MISSSRVLFNSALRPGLSSRYAISGWAGRPTASTGLIPHIQQIALSRRWDSTTQNTSGINSPASTTRTTSTSTVDQSGDHIVTGPNEFVLFLDNVFPLGVITFLWRRWQTSDQQMSDALTTRGISDPTSLVKRAIPEGKLPIKVTEIIPRLKDGGAFVKFTPTEPGLSGSDVERAVRKHLEQHPIRPWYNPLTSVKARLVRGVPWLEDLFRLPKLRLKVEFCSPSPDAPGAVELSQETLYGLFRRYGKIAEITPQPSDSKIVPRYAHVDFHTVRDSIMARNCMHGFVLAEEAGGGKNGTRLRLSYEQRVKPHHIWGWLTNHPRIVIPIVAALLAAITVVIFDPIREFFIRMHIQRSFKLSNIRLYRWFKRQTDDILAFRKHKGEQAGLKALWSQRKDIIDKVQTWLLENADTFIVVQGPRGSGTKELITDQALEGRKNVLVVDCKPVVDARGESGTIRKLAWEVGYRPVFSWANSLSSLVDLAVQGTTGVKSGFSETLESQLVKILHSAASALKHVSLADRGDDDQDSALSEDAYLEAHPERRAVVVIDNFLHKNEDGSLVYDKVAEWAALLVQSNIAHVIFLTNDSSYSKSLSRSLPDRVFRQVALGDLSPAVAKEYVLSHLEGLDHSGLMQGGEGGEKTPGQQQQQQHRGTEHEEREPEGEHEQKRGWLGTKRRPSSSSSAAAAAANTDADSAGGEATTTAERKRRRDLSELDGCINTLGGRLTDLEFLARRLKTGQSPSRAVAEIVEQSSSEILKIFLLGKGSPADSGGSNSKGGSDASSSPQQRRWSPEQAWYLIKEVAAKGSLRYNEVLLSGTFASSTTPGASDGEAAVEALASAELVTVTSHRGRPQTVRAGRPVYEAAFALLASDVVLRARMDLALLSELARIEAKGIDKVETELALLAGLPRQPRETADRVNYLLAKLQGSQSKIVMLEKEMAVLKGVLCHEA